MSVRVTQLVWDCLPGDTTIRLADATGLMPGHKVQINSEVCRVAQGYTLGAGVVPVVRGQDSTVTTPHPYRTLVVFGDAVTDFALTPAAGLASDRPGMLPAPSLLQTPYMGYPGTPQPIPTPESLAIPLPTSVGLTIVHLENANNYPYTLAAPTPDMDGTLLLLTTDVWPAPLHITNLRWGPRVVSSTLTAQNAALLVAASSVGNNGIPAWLEITKQLGG